MIKAIQCIEGCAAGMVYPRCAILNEGKHVRFQHHDNIACCEEALGY